MKPSHPLPDEEEIDRLLARQLRATTPAFEARWRDLAGALREEPRRQPHRVRPAAWPWLGLAAGLAVAWVWLSPAQPGLTETPSPALAELFEWENALAPAAPLLEEENREALLHLAP